MVPKAGLEPARLSPLPPQDSVSTNSTTWAIFLLDFIISNQKILEWNQSLEAQSLVTALSSLN